MMDLVETLIYCFIWFMTPKGKERHVLPQFQSLPLPPPLILASSGVGMVGSCFLLVGAYHTKSKISITSSIPTSPPHHPLNYNWAWCVFFFILFPWVHKIQPSTHDETHKKKIIKKKKKTTTIYICIKKYICVVK